MREMLDAGITCIELGSAHKPTEGIIPKLLQLRDKYQCRFLMHNYFPPADYPFVLNPASLDSEVLEFSRDFIRRSIDICSLLSIPMYSVHPGFTLDFPAPSGGSYNKLQTSQSNPCATQAGQAFEICVQSFGLLAEYAQQRNVTLAIENMYNSDGQNYALLCRTNEFEQLFGEIRNSNLAILADLGHLKVAAHWEGFDCRSFLNSLSQYIKAFHIHDNDGTVDSHQPAQPGSWIADVLQQSGFSTLPVIIEAKFENVMSIKRHIDRLSREISAEKLMCHAGQIKEGGN